MAILRMPVRLDWNGSGSPGANVFHFRSGGAVGDAPDPTDVADAVEQVRLAYVAARADLRHNMTISFDGVLTTVGDESPVYVETNSWSEATTSTGEYAPQLLAVVIGWSTSSATRSGRGRTFLGPWKQAAINADGSPETTVVTAAESFAGIINDWDATGAAFGVWSPSLNLIRDITGFRVRDRWAYLSSRRD